MGLQRRFSGQLVAFVCVGAAFLTVACGEDGATPKAAECPSFTPSDSAGSILTFDYVNATRFEPQSADQDPIGLDPMNPSPIMPSTYGTILIPDPDGATHRAVASDPLFGAFAILDENGNPKACATGMPCGGEQTCGMDGRCYLTTRYYNALQAGQEEALVQLGYKESPGVLKSSNPEIVLERCEPSAPGADDVVNGPVCGETAAAGVQCCTKVLYPGCFTPSGTPGAGR